MVTCCTGKTLIMTQPSIRQDLERSPEHAVMKHKIRSFIPPVLCCIKKCKKREKIKMKNLFHGHVIWYFHCVVTWNTVTVHRNKITWLHTKSKWVFWLFLIWGVNEISQGDYDFLWAGCQTVSWRMVANAEKNQKTWGNIEFIFELSFPPSLENLSNSGGFFPLLIGQKAENWIRVLCF